MPKKVRQNRLTHLCVAVVNRLGDSDESPIKLIDRLIVVSVFVLRLTLCICRMCEEGNAEMVEFLLDCGADASAHVVRGLSPLHAACVAGHTQVVKTLLQVSHSCDPPYVMLQPDLPN